MKRGGPIARKTPMRRIRERAEAPVIERQPQPPSTVRSLHRGTYSGSTSGVPIAKEKASQHSGYMAAVRDLGYCMLCRRACRPEFAHADQGKGERIKTDVRRGWPGCGAGVWGPGCHWLLCTSGTFTKEERRTIEADLGRRTRNAVLAAGLWPKRLALWKEER